MYKELQKLINQNRESHAVLIPSPSSTNVYNYIALRTPMTQSVEAALLDSVSTHTIFIQAHLQEKGQTKIPGDHDFFNIFSNRSNFKADSRTNSKTDSKADKHHHIILLN